MYAAAAGDVVLAAVGPADRDRSKRDVPGVTYASMPMIGLIPAAVACLTKSYAPKTLPWSVIASAGIPIRAASVNRSFSRAAPSSMEYSVCTCRCTKESLEARDTA